MSDGESGQRSALTQEVWQSCMTPNRLCVWTCNMRIPSFNCWVTESVYVSNVSVCDTTTHCYNPDS